MCLRSRRTAIRASPATRLKRLQSRCHDPRHSLQAEFGGKYVRATKTRAAQNLTCSACLCCSLPMACLCSLRTRRCNLGYRGLLCNTCEVGYYRGTTKAVDEGLVVCEPCGEKTQPVGSSVGLLFTRRHRVEYRRCPILPHFSISKFVQ